MPTPKNDTIGLILHFRTPEKTLKCIKSLIDNELKNIILIDNSEDSGISLLELQPKLNDISKNGVNFFIKSTGLNQGFSKAVNLGFKYAKEKGYKNLLLINSDAELKINSLKNLLKDLSNASICLPFVQNKENNTPVSLTGFYQPCTGLNFNSPKIATFKYVSGCCLLLKITEFESPLLDEDLFFYGEDVEFSYRIKNQHKITECKDAFIFHEGSGSSKNGSLFYEYNINRSNLILALKFSKNNFQLIYFIILRFFTLSTRAIFRSIRYKKSTAIYGLYLATTDLIKGKNRNLTPPYREESR